MSIIRAAMVRPQLFPQIMAFAICLVPRQGKNSLTTGFFFQGSILQMSAHPYHNFFELTFSLISCSSFTWSLLHRLFLIPSVCQLLSLANVLDNNNFRQFSCNKLLTRISVFPRTFIPSNQLNFIPLHIHKFIKSPIQISKCGLADRLSRSFVVVGPEEAASSIISKF